MPNIHEEIHASSDVARLRYLQYSQASPSVRGGAGAGSTNTACGNAERFAHGGVGRSLFTGLGLRIRKLLLASVTVFTRHF